MTSHKYLNSILFVFFLAFLSSSAAIAETGRADVYKVTMDRMELCTDSTCSSPLLVCSVTASVDIASKDAGTDIGSWCPLSGLPIGATYSHYRIRVSRTFTISGSVTGDGTDIQPAGDICMTQTGAGNAATTTKWGFGKATGTAGEQTMVIHDGDGSQAITRSNGSTGAGSTHSNSSGGPTGATAWCVGTDSDAAANAQCTAANTTGSTTWATLASADHLQIIYPFSASWTVGPVTPKMTISFNTSTGLGAFHDPTGTCNMYAESPTVTVTVN